jgi:hypothetical protein
MSEQSMPFRRRLGDDPVSGKIDSMMMETNSNEAKGVLNTLRSINEKIEVIAEYLHNASTASHETEQKMINLLDSLQARQDKHEQEYTENKAKISVWKSMINSFSGVALIFSIWAANQYFDLRDSKNRTESRLNTAEERIQSNINEIVSLKDTVNSLRIDNVQNQVTDTKKKQLKLESLRVIKASK